MNPTSWELSQDHKASLKKAREELCRIVDPPFGVTPLSEVWADVNEIIASIETLLGII